MNKIAFSLQDLISGVLQSAEEKLASEAPEKKEKKIKTLLKQEAKTNHQSEDDDTKLASLTDPDYVEKLATAVDIIASNVDNIQMSASRIFQSAEKVASETGPGKGPGHLTVSKSRGGQQAYKKDKTNAEDAAESESKSPLGTNQMPGGKTLMENDMNDAPGGGAKKPTGKYPAKGPLVAGPSAGHAKQASLRDILMRKLAGEDVMKANISASGSHSPLPGGGGLTVTQAGESGPRQSGDAIGSTFGNAQRKHIMSNTAPVKMTKGEAKKPQINQVEALISARLNSKTDSKLEENLQNTGKAGVKIATADSVSLLRKIAGEGCICSGKGECNYCKMKAAMKKQANAMMGPGGPGSPGGMPAAAEAGANPDGCTCGGTGECRVCKLKAALAAANSGNGMPAPAPVAQ